jgi:hypothetical protein
MTSSTMTTETGTTATAETQSTPIAEYAMLADCNSAAHVSPAGSVDWRGPVSSTGAEALFEQLAAYANDVGLLAEEIDKARAGSSDVLPG